MQILSFGAIFFMSLFIVVLVNGYQIVPYLVGTGGGGTSPSGPDLSCKNQENKEVTKCVGDDTGKVDDNGNSIKVKDAIYAGTIHETCFYAGRDAMSACDAACSSLAGGKDKDGNQLCCSSDTGIVTNLQDKPTKNDAGVLCCKRIVTCPCSLKPCGSGVFTDQDVTVIGSSGVVLE